MHGPRVRPKDVNEAAARASAGCEHYTMTYVPDVHASRIPLKQFGYFRITEQMPPAAPQRASDWQHDDTKQPICACIGSDLVSSCLQSFIMLLHRSLSGKIAVGQASQAALATSTCFVGPSLGRFPWQIHVAESQPLLCFHGHRPAALHS